MVTQQGSGAIVWLAWAYVGCRVIHSVVHLGSNKIMPRMTIYAVSWAMLIAMWGVVVFGL